MRIIIACIGALFIATLMTMTGRGGGNFYVPLLVATGEPMHQAATTGQFILMMTAFAGMIIFQKHKTVDWKLALIIEPPTNLMAFIGGFFAHMLSAVFLKILLAGLLVIAGFAMLIPIKERPIEVKRRFGYLRRTFNGQPYVVNLWLGLPTVALAGLAAGAVGISGGSFKVPLMVLAFGVPMKIAVGTSSAMIAATAATGFLGHLLAGDFNPSWALPIGCVATIGGIIGGKFAVWMFWMFYTEVRKVFHYKPAFFWVFCAVFSAPLCVWSFQAITYHIHFKCSANLGFRMFFAEIRSSFHSV